MGSAVPPLRLNAYASSADKFAFLCSRFGTKAERAHLDAENTFDEAERQLSTRLAREGCAKAIASWELHEAAIRKAEAASTGIHLQQ
jgi:hypothetical protein